MTDLSIAVLGAGVVGLTTAFELQQQFRGARITILSDKFNEDTTSYVAAGHFRPSTYFTGPTEAITREWIKNSYNYWDGIRITAEASDAGVAELSGYVLSSVSPQKVRNHLIEDVVPIYRAATEEERTLCPGDWKYGSFFTSLLIECGIFLPWAMDKFQKAGGNVINKKVNSLSHLAGKYDVTVNCTGIGAKSLCNDHKLVPIRGQILKVHAPWIKMFFYGDNDTYIIPGFNSITLGGTYNFDSYNLNACKYEALGIRERCEAMLPSLKTATIVDQRVGLRPHRDPVRIEKEVINVQESKLRIVHNYGHSSYGVTTAPGTSIYAVKLVKEMLAGNSKL